MFLMEKFQHAGAVVLSDCSNDRHGKFVQHSQAEAFFDMRCDYKGAHAGG